MNFEIFKILSKANLSKLMIYRMAVMAWMLNGIMPIITMFVWIRLAQEGGVQGRHPKDFVAYFMAVFFVSQMIASPVVGDLSRDIQMGGLSQKLLYPLDPFWSYLANKMAYFVIGVPIFLPSLLVVMILNPIHDLSQIKNYFCFLLACIFSAIIHFNRQYIFGLFSFWTTQTLAISRVWESFHYVLSGAFAPLVFYPAVLQKFIYCTPFPYVISFPAEMILGNLSSQEIVFGFCGQCFWIVLLVLLRKQIWQRGLSQYEAVGL